MINAISIICITLFLILHWVGLYIERVKTKFYKGLCDVYLFLLSHDNIKAYCEDRYGPVAAESIAIYRFCNDLLKEVRASLTDDTDNAQPEGWSVEVIPDTGKSENYFHLHLDPESNDVLCNPENEGDDNDGLYK